MSCDSKLAGGVRALCAPGTPIASACGGNAELAAAVLLELNDLTRARASQRAADGGRLAQIQARARLARAAEDATALLTRMQAAMAHDPTWRVPVHGEARGGQAVPLPRDGAATEGLAAMERALTAVSDGQPLPLLAQQIRYARLPRQGDGPAPALRRLLDAYPELLSLANGGIAPSSRQHAALSMAYDALTRPGMGGAPGPLKDWRRALRRAADGDMGEWVGVVDDASDIDALAPAAAGAVCAAAGVTNCGACRQFISPTAAHVCPSAVEQPVAARMAALAAGADAATRLDALLPLLGTLEGSEREAALREAMRAVASAQFEQRCLAALRLLPYLEPGSDAHVALAIQTLETADLVVFRERAAVVRDVIPHLPASELETAWRLAHDLPDSARVPPEMVAARAEALRRLRERMDPEGHRLLLQTVIDVTDVAPETQALLDRLRADPHLAVGIWRTAQTWRGPYERMQAGCFLYPHLPPADREEVTDAIGKLENDWWAFIGYGEIAEHQADAREAYEWRQRQLDVVYRVVDPDLKRSALEAFARSCPEACWRDLIEVARRVDDPTARMRALGCIMEYAPEWALAEIAGTVARVRTEQARAVGLAYLAYNVPED